MNGQQKFGVKKMIALCLILASFAAMFFPWITISIEIMGQKYSMDKLIDLGLSASGMTKAEYMEDMRESLMDAAEEAAEEGYRLDVNGMMDILEMFLEGEISPIDIATASSFLSGLLGDVLKSMKSSGLGSSEMIALSGLESSKDGLTTAAIVSWGLIAAMAVCMLLAIYSLVKEKKAGCICYAGISCTMLAVFAYVNGVLNDSVGSVLFGMLGSMGGMMDMGDISGIIGTDLFHLSAAPFVCAIAAVLAAILQWVDMKANRAPAAPAYTPVGTPVAQTYAPAAPVAQSYAPVTPVAQTYAPVTPVAQTYAPVTPVAPTPVAPAAPAPAAGWTCTCGAVNDHANRFCYACGQVYQDNTRCSCGAPKNPGQAFCAVCGKKFEDAAAPVENKNVFCPSCGSSQSAENAFCQFCGTKL